MALQVFLYSQIPLLYFEHLLFNLTVGTVWMQQILVKIMEKSQPEWVQDGINRARVPWLEGRSEDDPFRDRPDPRIFRSHLPPDMLPHGVKDKQIKVTICYIQLCNH